MKKVWMVILIILAVIFLSGCGGKELIIGEFDSNTGFLSPMPNLPDGCFIEIPEGVEIKRIEYKDGKCEVEMTIPPEQVE